MSEETQAAVAQLTQIAQGQTPAQGGAQPATSTPSSGGAVPDSGVTPAVASPPASSPGPTPDQIIAEAVAQATGGRTKDISELVQYLKVADAVLAEQTQKQQADQTQAAIAAEDEALAELVAKEFKKHGSAAKGLAWLYKQATEDGAKIAIEQFEKRQAKMTAQQRQAEEGRIRFFSEHPNLVKHAHKVDALVAKGMHPKEAAELLSDLVPSDTTGSPGAPSMTKEQIETAFRANAYVQPHVYEETKRFNEHEAHNKLVKSIEAKLEKAEEPGDVWAALLEYKPQTKG